MSWMINPMLCRNLLSHHKGLENPNCCISRANTTMLTLNTWRLWQQNFTANSLRFTSYKKRIKRLTRVFYTWYPWERSRVRGQRAHLAQCDPRPGRRECTETVRCLVECRAPYVELRRSTVLPRCSRQRSVVPLTAQAHQYSIIHRDPYVVSRNNQTKLGQWLTTEGLFDSQSSCLGICSYLVVFTCKINTKVVHIAWRLIEL